MQPDTRTLLKTGSMLLLTGAAAAVLMLAVFGGVSHQGPHSTMGWLALMLAMGCVPTGLLSFLLGFAKYVGERRRARS